MIIVWKHPRNNQCIEKVLTKSSILLRRMLLLGSQTWFSCICYFCLYVRISVKIVFIRLGFILKTLLFDWHGSKWQLPLKSFQITSFENSILFMGLNFVVHSSRSICLREGFLVVKQLTLWSSQATSFKNSVSVLCLYLFSSIHILAAS